MKIALWISPWMELDILSYKEVLVINKAFGLLFDLFYGPVIGTSVLTSWVTLG